MAEVDMSNYGWMFRYIHITSTKQYPGFVKRVIRRCRRIEKTQTRRRDRHQAKLRLAIDSED